MTDTYKATPEQWQKVEGWASVASDSCILELRARVAKLEVQASNYPAIPDSSTPPPVATDEELRKIYSKRTSCYRHRTEGQMTTPAPDFRALCAELLDELQYQTSYETNAELQDRARTALATPPPEPPTSQITFNAPPTEEVIRLDKEGFHYKGQFIADAGEAHRLMLVFLKQHAKAEPEPPTDDDLNALWNCCGDHDEDGDHYGNIFQFARAALKRWGAK
jgi:hypothetical protein